jgi:hypothetical protein
MQIKMKSSSSKDNEKEKEYTFAGLYRAEYAYLRDFVESKEITIDNAQVTVCLGIVITVLLISFRYFVASSGSGRR